MNTNQLKNGIVFGVITMLLLSMITPMTLGYHLDGENKNDLCAHNNQGGSYINEDESSIAIGNDYVELVFDKTFGGGLDKIIDRETGLDLRSNKDQLPYLYYFLFHNGTDVEGALQYMGLSVDYIIQNTKDYSEISIVHSNIKGYDLHTTTTIRVDDHSPFARMRLSITNNEDFVLRNIYFPFIFGIEHIGSSAEDDTLFLPVGDGILIHNPLSVIDKLYESNGLYPGTQSMQVMSHYDKNQAGLYIATYDPHGNPKTFDISSGGTCLKTSIKLYLPETIGNDFSMDYDLVLGTFHGDWYKAAALYREWAETTPFVSGGKVSETKEIPEWFDDTSIIQLVNRNHPDEEILSLTDIVEITKEYSIQSGVVTTVLIIGWEQNGAWVGPYYYPPVEGEHAFQTAMHDLKQDGNHGFIYISGTVWRITRDDIGYADYALFNTIGLPWVALQRDQTPYFDPGYETIGWHSGRMCPLTDFWHDMVVENALESVRLGCDVVQIDEFPIGAMYPCYNASHNHPIGYSNAISYAYQSILEDIRSQGRTLNPDFVMSIEEPCEFYLPVLDTYVSRDCAPEGLLYMDVVNVYGDTIEFIPFFSFVYHEYITSFGEGIGMDKDYAVGFYNQMARALAKMFVSGEIIKVGGTTPDQWDMDLFELFSRAAIATTTYAKGYLIYGEPLIPPELDVPLIKIDWYNAIRGEFGNPIHEPAVFNSAWRGDDGSKGFIFTNWYPSTVDFHVEIQDETLPEGYYALSLIRNGEGSIIVANTTLPRTITMSLDQNDIVLIEIIEAVNTNPPNIPEIKGPINGEINTEYLYTITTTDPDGDTVSFFIDWGDESDEGWSGYISSGLEVNLTHTWEHADTYVIKVKAKDVHGVESDWETIEVTMPKRRVSIHPFIQFLLELLHLYFI